MFRNLLFSSCVLCIPAGMAAAAPVYLNIDNITVSLGAYGDSGSFNNTFDDGATVAKAIDAPSADAEEFHNQATHFWWTAEEPTGRLHLAFDFGVAYDITTLHFWNYTGEAYDVDEITFQFFDSDGDYIDLLTIYPDLGTAPGITAQDIALHAPLNIRYVDAYLSGSNGQVDFQNIGFTATVSEPAPAPVPLPAAGVLALAGLGSLGLLRRRR